MAPAGGLVICRPKVDLRYLRLELCKQYGTRISVVPKAPTRLYEATMSCNKFSDLLFTGRSTDPPLWQVPTMRCKRG